MTKTFLTMLCLLLSLGLTAAPADKKPKKQKTAQKAQIPAGAEANTPAGQQAQTPAEKPAAAASSAAQPSDQPILPFAETMPAFEGGTLNDFYTWVKKRVQYPKELAGSGKRARVEVAFVIETDGSLSSIQMAKPADSLFFKEAQRVILSSPKWTPGVQKGKDVRVRFLMPVDFREK